MRVFLCVCVLDNASETQRTEFLNEITLMKTMGQHAHIISMLACCTHDQPLCLVVEHLPHGDLLHFLRRCRSQQSAASQVTVWGNCHCLSYVAMCVQCKS